MRPSGVALLLALAVAGCMPKTSYNVATRQQETTITSTEREVAIGRRLARDVEKEMGLVPDEAVQQRVKSIGARLAAVCERQELIYSFAAVDEEEVNAFSLPGGYVFVNEGLIDKTDNDDELAAVIAHEIAHVVARHSVKRFETGLGYQLAQIATIAVAREAGAARGVSLALQSARLAYSRQDELDADRLGAGYLKAAGFDPKAMLTFLDKLHDIHADKLHYMPRGVVRPQYAMSHPYIPDRVRAVKEALFGVADYIDYLNTPD
jgi:predicted Zn-dependent protease